MKRLTKLIIYTILILVLFVIIPVLMRDFLQIKDPIIYASVFFVLGGMYGMTLGVEL